MVDAIGSVTSGTQSEGQGKSVMGKDDFLPIHKDLPPRGEFFVDMGNPKCNTLSK